LIRKGINNEWALVYTDKNRDQLLAKYPTVDKFVTEFNFSEQEIKDMIAMAEKEEIPFNEEQYKISERAIKIRTKALIARDLYNGAAFYKVINDLNPALKKAVESLKDGTFDKMNLHYQSEDSKKDKKNKTKKNKTK
jgi:carboxyl-terminal processing protease